MPQTSNLDKKIMKYKHPLLKIHFGLLLFVFLNFIFRQITDLSVSSFIIFIAKIIIYTSGFILLFLTIKTFDKKSIYFSIYLLSPLGVIFAWLVDGIFGALIGSLFLWTISVDDFVVKSENYKITQQFTGFMGACCKYNLIKNYFYLAEKTIGDFTLEESDLTAAIFTVNENDNTLTINYKIEGVNNKTQNADTTLTLN